MKLENSADSCAPHHSPPPATVLPRANLRWRGHLRRGVLLAMLVVATYPAWRWAAVFNDGELDWRSWCGSGPGAGNKLRRTAPAGPLPRQPVAARLR